MPRNQGKENAMKRRSGHSVADVADNDTVGGMLVVHVVPIPDAATADYDIILKHKERVIDVLVEKRAANAAAANTIQVKNAANAISDAIDTNDNDTILSRAGSINDANSTINAGGTLRVTSTKAGGNAACNVIITCLRVA